MILDLKSKEKIMDKYHPENKNYDLLEVLIDIRDILNEIKKGVGK